MDVTAVEDRGVSAVGAALGDLALDAGKVRLLAVTGATRSPLTPQVPTLTELGYPGFEADVWGGLFLPGKTPPAVVKRLESEVQKIVLQPDFQAKVRELGYVPGGKPQAEFAKQVTGDQKTWGELILSQKLQLD